MSHRDKVEHLITALKQKGVSTYTTAPPLFRMLWKFGMSTKPPFFMSFSALTLLMGMLFGGLWGVCMWLLQWRGSPLHWGVAVGISAGAGLMFGLLMAAYYRWKAKKLGLPTWEEYPKE